MRERREEIDITYRGCVVARIVPVAPEPRGARRSRTAPAEVAGMLARLKPTQSVLPVNHRAR